MTIRPKPEAAQPPRRRSVAAVAGFGSGLAFAFVVLVGLGVWQIHRLAWKTDLIARVDARIHAEPVEAPGPAAWGGLSATGDEYLRVRATGTYLADRETLVQALTALGAGFWVLEPLRRPDGSVVVVNRGFVPADRRDAPVPAGDAPASVTGLLRLSEPGGGFLRHNDPKTDRWFSRDVAAIASARGLTNVAPYFIDAEADPAAPPGAPVGGLTVIAFPNNHLVYAFTWFALAAMVAGGGFWLGREEWRSRKAGHEAS